MSEISTAFEPGVVYSPFYTGGNVAISQSLISASVSNDENVSVTNLETGEQLDLLKVEDIITSLAISPDSSYIVAFTRSAQMVMFAQSSDGYKLTKRVKAHDAPVLVSTIESTSTLLATGGAEGIVKVWDLAGGYVTHNFTGHGGAISALAFHGSGNNWKLASGSDDTKIRLWDLVKSKSVAVLDSHVSVIRGLQFSSDGKTLVSGGRDNVISVWRGTKLINTIPVMESLETVGYFDEDSGILYTGGASGAVKLWDMSSGKAIKAEHTSTEGADDISVVDIYKRQQHDSSTALYVSYNDQSIVELDEELEIVRRIAGSHGEIIDCAYLGDDELVLATNSSPQIRIVNKTNRMVDYKVLAGHTDIVLAIDVTSDGKWLASSSKDREARLWKTSDQSQYRVFQGHAGSVGAIGLPRRQIGKEPPFVITGSQDLTVKKWNVKQGTAEYTRKAHEKDINAIDVSPDDRFFATASQDRTVKIWDLETGEAVGILKGHKRGVWAVKFNPFDHNSIVTASGDKTVKVWSLRDFSCTRTFQGHSNSVLKVGFINRGAQVVSAAGDGLVKVWDVKGDEVSATLDNHEDKVWSLAVRGSEIVSGGGDSVITVWQDVTEQQQQQQDQQREQLIEDQQKLDNLVRNGDYKDAVLLALQLDQPLRLYKLFSQMSSQEVSDVVGTLDPETIGQLLLRVRDWNTRARTADLSQTVLATVLRSRGVDELMAIPGFMKVVDGLVAYSRRHYDRVDGMLEESYFLDYVIDSM